jgi:hypothetical protein
LVITPFLNDNLESLREEEERIRTESGLFINSREDLKQHVELVHLYMDVLNDIYRKAPNQLSDEEQVLFGLGIRMFNSAASLLRLALSGYYQGAVSFLRDILEIGFLLDYFYMKPDRVLVWRADSSAWEFTPKRIRKVLDARDGYKDEGRARRYQLLSSTGTHASFKGLELVVNNGGLTMGPFFKEDLLVVVLFEAATHTAPALIDYMSHFADLSQAEMQQRVLTLERIGAWFCKYQDPGMTDRHMRGMAELRAALSMPAFSAPAPT